MSRMAVTAWQAASVKALSIKVAQALGGKPESEVDDIIPHALVDTVVNLVLANSNERRTLVDEEDMQKCENEYVELIRRASETKSERFLAAARRRVHAAIVLSLAARLNVISLQQAYRSAPIGAALSFVVEVAAYWRDFKRQSSLIDQADLLAGELEPVNSCKLCLLDRRGVPVLAMQALRRLLPQAFICLVS